MRLGRTLLFCLGAALLALLPAGARAATTWYVATNGDDTADGISAGAAFGTIQHAINRAAAGDTIVIAAGTYGESLLSPKSLSFQGAGATTTIIDPRAPSTPISNSCLVINAGSHSFDIQTSIQGLTLKNGTVTGFGSNGGAIRNFGGSLMVTDCTLSDGHVDQDGGAIFNAFGTLNVTNCTFRNNKALDGGGIDYGGGAICSLAGDVTVDGCTFTGNSALLGGAIYVHGFDGLTVTNSTFSQNHSDEEGGAVCGSTGEVAITGCHFTGNSSGGNAGAFEGLGGHSVLSNCDFTGNTAARVGGAVMINGFNTPGAVTACTFTRNSAARGGGMYTSSGPVVVTGCIFGGNAATADGGAIFAGGSGLKLVNCVSSGNKAAGNGGGLCNMAGGATVLNCTFASNTATGNGGAIAGVVNPLNTPASPNITNCILWGNTAAAGSGIYTDATSTATVTYSDVQDLTNSTPDASTYNFKADPIFVRNPGAGVDGKWGTDDDDYGDLRLQSGLPCQDRGNDAVVTAPPFPTDAHNVIVDLDGNPRIIHAHVDLGAYEYQANHAPVAIAGAAQTVTVPHDGDPNTDTAPVNLDGSASSDPDGDTLSYYWSDGYANTSHDAKPGFSLSPGTYTFTLLVIDPYGASNSATVKITVNAEPNQTPSAGAQSVTVDQDTSLNITLAGSDPDGAQDTITYAVGTGPSHGTLSGLDAKTGAVTYTPGAGYVGTDSFTFTATDAYGASSDTATVSITVLDTTPPVITVPSDIVAYATRTSGVVVTYPAPTAVDNVDGPVAVTSTPASGSLFAPGKNTVTVTATDAAHHTSTKTFVVWVQYQWSGVLQPINADGSSVFKACSTIPVKFALTGASARITDLSAAFSAKRIAASTGTVNECVTAASPTSGSQFRYDASCKQYIYNWSTKGLSTGMYQISIDLGDGVTRTVNVGLR